MDGDDFHTSLQQLRLQLDLMNKRTASVLNKSHQHSTKVTHESSQVGHLPPVVMADYAQQIKHIGATVGALARQQEDRFQRLEHQLNLLSGKLDDLDLTDPQPTPPESSTSSLHEQAEPHFDLSFGKSSDIPRQTSGMPSATVADVGGYFYPNHIQYSHNNQQYISDALTFVGRVNRTLRTKSINNIEIFLRGSELPAARDCCGEKVLNPVEHKQKMCQSINFLADEGAEILSDFEEKLAALKKWLHKNHTHEDSDDEIKLLWHRVAYMIWIHEQRILESSKQHFVRSQDSDSEFVFETKKPSRGHQRPFDSSSTITGRTENSRNQILRAQEKVCILDNRSEKAAVALNLETPKMLERFKPKVVESIEAADEPYPPAPTAELCPTTPIVPCQVAASPLNGSELDHNIPVSPKIAKKFGLQPGRQPSQQQLLQMQQQMHMQRMAQQQKNTKGMEKTVQTNDYSQNIPHQQISVLEPQDRSGRNSVDIDRGRRTNVLESTNINPSTLSSYEPLKHAPIDLSRTRPEQGFPQLRVKRDVLPFFACSPEPGVYLPHSASADMDKHTTISNYDTIERLKPPRTLPIHETKKDETERTKNAAEEMLATTTHDHQHGTPSIDPYSYVSGCTGAKEPLEEYLKHLEFGSLDDQGCTHYAHMLKDHAAAVAEEDHEIKIPHKPFWREREAMEATSEVARSQKFRGW